MVLIILLLRLSYLISVELISDAHNDTNDGNYASISLKIVIISNECLQYRTVVHWQTLMEYNRIE
jgi:hypothetical protein